MKMEMEMRKVDIVSNDARMGVYVDGSLLDVVETHDEVLEVLVTDISWHERWDLDDFPAKLSDLDAE